MRYLAYYDPMTRLPNRQRLLEIITQLGAWASPRGRRIAVLALDIDNFSRINDTLGQVNGDTLIADIAARLQHCLRDPDRALDQASRADRYQRALRLAGADRWQ